MKIFQLIIAIVILVLIFALSTQAADTGLKSPSATGETSNDWTNTTIEFSNVIIK